MAVDQKFHKNRKRINVALQGGGAHGAFTWGVLERLMLDDRLFIDGLSGTSAGAMNAVVFTDGFVRGRQRQAVSALHEFWRRVSEGALLTTTMNRPETPTMAREILNRINEISFNSSLVREMNGIATVSRLLDRSKVDGPGLAPVNFHLIQAEDAMCHLGSSSKFNADWSFLSYLRELGLTTADRWLAEHFDQIGEGSTLDMFSTYE